MLSNSLINTLDFNALLKEAITDKRPRKKTNIEKAPKDADNQKTKPGREQAIAKKNIENFDV